MNKNKVVKFFSFFVLAFVLLLSVFTFIPNKNSSLGSVSANDSTSYNYNFRGSDLTINAIALRSYGTSEQYAGFYDINISIATGNYYLTESYFYVNCETFSGDNGGGYDVSSLSLSKIEFTSSNTILNLANINFNTFVGDSNASVDYNSGLKGTYGFIGTYNMILPFGVSLSSSDFYANIGSVTIGVRSTPLVLPSNFGYRVLFIRYYDLNDNYIDFEFLTQNGYDFATRTYIFTSGLTDNQYYEQGYNAGLSANQDTIYNQGFNAGRADGYSSGYDAGVASANDYSFKGLFGAVIDAPITAFTSLLNFEIFGFNILGFITGLLTLIIIIYIVRVCLGGK